jgi:hypothetical protein
MPPATRSNPRPRPVVTAPMKLLVAAFLAAAASLAPPHVVQESKPMSHVEEFAFWIGEWECRDPAGNVAGTNRIEATLDGRVLHEHWSGTNGSRGESFNIKAADTGKWHQTWVDDEGSLLLLDGGPADDGSMLLEGARPAADGVTVRHRIRWTPRDDGTVQQTWTVSKNGGEQWTTVVDLTYTRVASGEK